MLSRVTDFLLKTNLGHVIVVVILVVVGLLGWLAWWLTAPLFTNETVDEAFPLSAQAVVPPDMTREEVEEIMTRAAEEVTEVDEPQVRAPAVSPTGQIVGSGKLQPAPRIATRTPEPQPTEEPVTSPSAEATEPPQEPATVVRYGSSGTNGHTYASSYSGTRSNRSSRTKGGAIPQRRLFS